MDRFVWVGDEVELVKDNDEHASQDYYDPSQPRQPKGTEKGGEFAPKNAMSPIGSVSSERKAQLPRIPPAWKEVHVADDPTAPLQVVGIDAKGRKQYIYSAEHSAAAAAEKFARLKEFAAIAPKVEAAALKDMRAGDHAAAATYLISRTGFRVGGDAETHGAVKAYGASTLLGKHVKVDGNKVSFDFVGKKGVRIQKELDDKSLADFVRKRKAGADERVFDTNAVGVRDYVKKHAGSSFKVKDFRTLQGTAKALDAINAEMRTPPKNAKERKSAFNRVKKAVAEHLGNTPAVAFSAYIDPGVWGRLTVVKD